MRLSSRWATVAALAACCLVAAVQASPAAAKPLFTGVTDGGPYEAPVFQHIRAAGASFVRIELNWGVIAPAAQPQGWQPGSATDTHYDWGAADAAVREAVGAGLTPVLMVYSAPQWAQRCKDPSGLLCDPDPAALAAFATAAATRYSGRFAGLPRVRYWQGLNEPNLSLYFNPQHGAGGRPVSPDLYRTLINSFYAAVKAVDPGDLVLAAGLGPIAVPGYTIGPMRFTRQLLCMSGRRHPHPVKGNCGGGVHFDIFDIHPYTTGGPSHQGGADDVEMGDLGKLRKLLRAADRAGRIKGRSKHTPLWITEFSWDSKPPDPGGLKMSIETGWTAEALYRAWKAGVTHFFWFSLRDQPPDPKLPFSETYQSGLYFRGPTVAKDRPKKVLYAFRFPFVAFHGRGHRSGLRFWGRTPTGSGGKVTIQVKRGKRWSSVSSAHADRHGIFRGSAGTGYGRDQHGFARAVFAGGASVPFSLHRVPDFDHPPFG